MRVIGHARETWLKISPDRATSSYKIIPLEIELPEPEWPFESMGEILELAFADIVIEKADHPVLLKAMGRK
jgi:hypothetical protein